MRPFTAALALMGGEFEMSGVARMHERPIGDLVDALRELGLPHRLPGQGGVPAAQDPPGPGAQAGRAHSGARRRFSQFLTALLMALPLVATWTS